MYQLLQIFLLSPSLSWYRSFFLHDCPLNPVAVSWWRPAVARCCGQWRVLHTYTLIGTVTFHHAPFFQHVFGRSASHRLLTRVNSLVIHCLIWLFVCLDMCQQSCRSLSYLALCLSWHVSTVLSFIVLSGSMTWHVSTILLFIILSGSMTWHVSTILLFIILSGSVFSVILCRSQRVLAASWLLYLTAASPTTSTNQKRPWPIIDVIQVQTDFLPTLLLCLLFKNQNFISFETQEICDSH